MNPSDTRDKDTIIRYLGQRDYPGVWRNMQHFTNTRTPDTADEIWLLEHSPVFTLGLNGKQEHVLANSDIPVMKCDRGGQVTYHGPGQLIIYLLLNLRRRELGVKTLVNKIEQAIIDLLQENKIHGHRREGAPGIYVNDAKIAALGLRIRRGCCYHGLSLNVNMDLEPFSRINPCGYAGLKTVQLHDLIPDINIEHISDTLLQQLQQQLAAG